MARGEVEQAEISHAPLSTFQQALVGLVQWLNKKVHGKTRAARIHMEHEAAVHIHESLARFLER
jgi:hypothetical protein